MKKTLITLLLIVFVSAAYTDFAFAGAKKELKVLFVGNSYTFFGNLPQIVSIISEGAPVRLVTRKSTAGGASLSDHWRGEKGLHTRELIRDGRFDIVVLQDISLGPVNEPDTLKKYARLFCDLIRKSRAKPYLFVTWAHKDTPQHHETIDKVYGEAALENNAEPVPVGDTWVVALKQKPDWGLFDPDMSHPSDLGTFLTACVFVESIVHQLPNPLPLYFYTQDADNESLLLMHIDQEDAMICRKIVVDVVNR
jgi:hypothetical protein